MTFAVFLCLWGAVSAVAAGTAIGISIVVRVLKRWGFEDEDADNE